MSVTEAREKLLSVQALRGIAAVLVLIFHIDAMFREGGPRSREFGEFWARGFAGVDLFFVISGFIMVYVTRDIAPSMRAAGRFLYDRVTRIYPLWWVFAGLMMLYFISATGSPAAADKAQGDGVLPYILKSLFLFPQMEEPVLGVGWTLIHEMLFYILFAAGLLLPRKFLPVWLGLWAAIIVVASFVMTGPLPLHAQNMTELFTSPMNMEFIFGAFVALLLGTQYFQGGNKSGVIYLGLGAALFALAIIADIPSVTRPLGLHLGHEEFNWMRVVIYGLPGALVVIGAVLMERAGRLKVPNFLVKIGDWSYSLYLSHLLVLLTLTRLWNMQVFQPYIPEPLKWGAEGWLDNIVYIIAAIMGSLIVAWASYHLIERPSLKLLRRKKKLELSD